MINLWSFPSLFLRPKAKSPPQDLLLKFEKEQTLKEQAQESSLFVFNLGLAKMKCCLLMNGLVSDPNEVLLTYTLGLHD